MSRENTLILLGILVALSPFSGLPHSWLLVLTPLLGILVAIIGVTLRGNTKLDSHSTQPEPMSGI